MARNSGMEKTPEGIRLQKVLAQAGIASRRSAEELIQTGRVTVNGKRAVLGQRVDPSSDRIEVDGSRIRTGSKLRYLLVNKPAGVITTARDTHGRPTVLDLVPNAERVFPVGRLDGPTEGLLLLTNDGELAHRMTHPSFELTKTYLAEVEGRVDAQARRALLAGVKIEEGRRAKATAVKVLSARGGKTPRSVVEMSLHEGRKHVVRKMFSAVGHPVRQLARTSIGPLRLGRLRPGAYRELDASEVRALYRAVGL